MADTATNYINGLFGLQGKVIIVTGSTGGLGYDMAKGLLQCGANVIINGRTEERVITARDSIYVETSKTTGLLAIAGDMSIPEDAQALVEKTMQAFGRIDVVINNAGINITERPFAESQPGDWERLSSVNIQGPINLTRSALPFLKQAPAGRIINLASMVGHVGMSNITLYTMTKAAILLFTKSLSSELASSSVTVNSVSPGVFETPMNAKFEPGSEQYDSIVKGIPMRRLGKPEELVGIVVYLSSTASSYTTGTDFLVDGGFTAV